MNIKYFTMSVFSRKCNLFFKEFQIALVCFLYFQNCVLFCSEESFFLSTLAMKQFCFFFKYIPLRRYSQQEYTGKLHYSYLLPNKNDSNAIFFFLHLGSTFLPRTLKFLSFNLSFLILCENGITNIFNSILQLGRPATDK